MVVASARSSLGSMAALAEGVVGSDSATALEFSPEDLQALLAPLEVISSSPQG